MPIAQKPKTKKTRQTAENAENTRKTSKAQMQANKKYYQDHYRKLSVDIAKSAWDRLSAQAELHNMSKAAYIVTSCDYYHQAHSKPGNPFRNDDTTTDDENPEDHD